MNDSKGRFRFRFSLWWLFIFVTAIAFCAFIYRITGPIETAGVAIALLLLGISSMLPRIRWRWLLTSGLMTLAAGIVWTVGIDYSEFLEGCDRCLMHRWIYEYRLFRQPVYSLQSHDHQRNLAQLAEDLGVPCHHRWERFASIRLWGFVYPTGSCFTCCLAGDELDEKTRVRVRAFAANNPQAGEEFRQMVLVKHDVLYLRKFMSELNSQPQSDIAPHDSR